MADLPAWLQRVGDVVLHEDGVTRQAAHTVSAVLNDSVRHSRHPTAVAANAAGVARVIVVAYPPRRRKVKTAECSRLSELVTKRVLVAVIAQDHVYLRARDGWKLVIRAR